MNEQQHVVSKQGGWAFGLICAFFLISRLLLLNYNEAEFTDGYAFIGWSFTFSSDFPYYVSGKYLPAYPLLIRLLSPFLDPIVSGRLISTFAGFLCLLPLYRLCLEVYGRRAALLASILFTVSAQILFLTTRVLSEPLFLVFSLATVLQANRLFSNSDMDSLPWLILFSGLATLTRPEGLAFAPLWILGLFRAVYLRRSKPVLWSIAPALLWLLALWMIYSGGSGYGNEMQRSLHSLSPTRFLMYSLTYIEIYPYLIFYPLFILFIYNQFRELTVKRRVLLLLVVYVHFAFLAVISVHWAWSTRLLALPMSLLLVEAAAGIERLENSAPKWLSNGWTVVSILGSIVFALVTLHFQKETFSDFKQTGEYIRSNFSDARIFSNDPFKESYYTRGNVNRYVPDHAYQQDDIIVLHSFYSHDLDQQLKSLEKRYQIEVLFRAESTVVPLIANTIITEASNTAWIASQRFYAQKFSGIVLRVKRKVKDGPA